MPASPRFIHACRVGVLLRVMILQHLYGLSDPQAEEQLKDRLSFQKFVQLNAHETVPDETTICRFRQRLIEGNLHEELLGLRVLRDAELLVHTGFRLHPLSSDFSETSRISSRQAGVCGELFCFSET